VSIIQLAAFDRWDSTPQTWIVLGIRSERVERRGF